MSTDLWRQHGVLAVLTDGPADLEVAALAADLAAERGTRILAAVALEAPRTVLDSAAAARRHRDDAAAVCARVQPTVAVRDVAVTGVPLLLPAGRSGWSPRRLSRTLRMLVRRSGAAAVVLPARPVLGVTPDHLAAAVPHVVVAGGAPHRLAVARPAR